MKFNTRTLTLSILAALTFNTAQAESASDKYSALLGNHNLIQSAQENLNAAESNVNVEESGWYPELQFSAEGGQDNYDRNNSDNSELNTNQFTARINQLVWDFGALNASIDHAQSKVEQARFELDRQKQYLMMSALEAELNVRKAMTVLNYAKKSENNIKAQTKLESTRIASGQGYTTDLLQAKSQLAAAQARRANAQGQLAQAQNRYFAVFGQEANTAQLDSTMPELNLTSPVSLEEAQATAKNNNPDLHVTHAQQIVAKADVSKTAKAEWMPKIALKADYINDFNPDGIEQIREQNNVALKMDWRFNTGMRASHAVDSMNAKARSVAQEVKNTEIQVAEDTRNAWTQLKTSEARLSYLNNQVELSERFLELARKERELGKRSLLDVLNGETSLINAQSDAAVAATDVKIAQLKLMLQTGQLDLAIFNK